MIPGILGIIAILGALIFLLNRHSKVKSAKEKAIPEIYRLTNEGNYYAALYLAEQTKKSIPDDPELDKMWSDFSNRVTTKSDPPGARIYRRNYDDTDTNWILLE